MGCTGLDIQGSLEEITSLGVAVAVPGVTHALGLGHAGLRRGVAEAAQSEGWEKSHVAPCSCSISANRAAILGLLATLLTEKPTHG